MVIKSLKEDEMREKFDVYQDIMERTGGELYIGVVGPVRSGKSTFIKRFMERLVLPNMEEGAEKNRTIDELPQSGSGRTITTTEPKFIPKEAVNIKVNENTDIHIRLVDCVGYIVDGASGYYEDEKERLVKTPWFEYDIPFSKAAHIGTKKVMTEHATIGVIVSTDGSFGEIPSESFRKVEKEFVEEMKAMGKPFVFILNSMRPGSKEAQDLAKQLSQNYGIQVMPLNCEQLKGEDLLEILHSILLEFPVEQLHFHISKWAETLEFEHPIKKSILQYAKDVLRKVKEMRDIYELPSWKNMNYIDNVEIDQVNLKNGHIHIKISIPDQYYYEMLSELLGSEVQSECEFLLILKELAEKRKQYNSISKAMESVGYKGYGLVMPEKNDIQLEEPELIKHGNKYGIKIKANAPSLHFIKAQISTEIAPIVGSQEQANEFLKNMKEQMKESPDSLWNINIFGKTVEQMVEEGLIAKSNKINDESQMRLQDTMEKIINDSNGGMVFILI